MAHVIVLASASPRRHALLREAGLAFAIEPAEADEGLPEGTAALAGALALAERKARKVADRHRGADVRVIGADTIVALTVDGGERLLGKPGAEGEARSMLQALSGSRHAVVTGVCVVCARSGRSTAAAETTWVSMRTIRPDEIEAYVASGEWRGKAGGYAIQETADRFVTGLSGGGLDNVVGLPVRLTLELLAQL